jgi:TonB family protein
MARSSQLEERLVAILDSRTRRTQPGRLAGLAVAAAAIALMAPLAAIRAQSTAEQQALPDVDVTIASANAQKNREILDQAAQSYEALRKFDQARKLREAALALTEQVSGQQSADYALALVRLGDLARRKGSIKESEEFYQRALALGDRPGIFPALMRLAFGSKDNDKAREYLERARVVGKDGNQVGSAMTGLAHQRQSEPNGVSYAESLYRGAMALEGPESPELALTLELYGQWKASLGDDSDAEPLLDRAKTIRKAVIVQKSAGIPRAPYSDPVVRVGGGVSAPALLKKMEPEYSEEARMLKLQGTVLLKIVVDVDGRAKNFELLRGLGYGLDEKAVDAVALWKFKPGTTRDGNPVPVQAQIEINFRLL